MGSIKPVLLFSEQDEGPVDGEDPNEEQEMGGEFHGSDIGETA